MDRDEALQYAIGFLSREYDVPTLKHLLSRYKVNVSKIVNDALSIVPDPKDFELE